MPSLIFRKGLDLSMRRCMLADNYHSASSIGSKPTTSRTARGRLTLHLAREFDLLRRGSRSRLRVSDTASDFPT